jgi:hypothetical protein
MQNSSAFQFLALDTIHESTANPAGRLKNPSFMSSPKASSSMASFSPSPSVRTRKASRSSRERDEAVTKLFG